MNSTNKAKQADKWSRVIRADEVTQTGAVFTLAADEEARASIAQKSGLLELHDLQARFEVERHGKTGLRVMGKVTATVIQACVVTLEPVTSELDEVIDLVFVPETELEVPNAAEIEITADPSDTTPEVLAGGALDLGALATEFLIMGIDPYPRKAGVAFETPTSKEAEPGPFAALAALKGKLPTAS